MSRRALVTGGAGFIGSTLVDRLLEDDWTVTVVDDFSHGRASNLARARAGGRLAVVESDVRAPHLIEVFAEHRPDTVFHLAAQIDVRISVDDPVLDADVNVLGSLNVLECARRTGAGKVLIASSAAVYGRARRMPIDESARGTPESPYGIAKRVLGDYLTYYRRTYGMRSALMTLANVYGPRQDPFGEAGVIAIFLSRMLQGAPTRIYGDGTQTRDFVYVGDVADAFARAAVRGSGRLNVGTGRETTVRELWGTCASITGFRGEPSFAPARAGELPRNALDAARARRTLEWSPSVSLREGLAATASAIAAELASSAPGRARSAGG